jgi:transcriptional regulator
MYLPAHFEESRPEVLHELMRSHPLGLLVTQDANGLQANAIPFMLEPERGPLGTLVAHVARANPLWREARTDVESMVVFQGPQAYISPAWYPTKQETGKVVPTWNYVMVEARGRLRVIDDAAWVHQLVSRLTERHEATQAAPWKVSDAPADYIASMQRAIVGIEIELSALQGKWKVSQNRNTAERGGVVAALGQHPMAALVDSQAAST